MKPEASQLCTELEKKLLVEEVHRDQDEFPGLTDGLEGVAGSQGRDWLRMTPKFWA